MSSFNPNLISLNKVTHSETGCFGESIKKVLQTVTVDGVQPKMASDEWVGDLIPFSTDPIDDLSTGPLIQELEDMTEALSDLDGRWARSRD